MSDFEFRALPAEQPDKPCREPSTVPSHVLANVKLQDIPQKAPPIPPPSLFISASLAMQHFFFHQIKIQCLAWISWFFTPICVLISVRLVAAPSLNGVVALLLTDVIHLSGQKLEWCPLKSLRLGLGATDAETCNLDCTSTWVYSSCCAHENWVNL